MDEKTEKTKKQVPLRLNPVLYEELTRWADDELRSLNSQIEYVLLCAVKERRDKNIFEKIKSGD